MDEVVKFLQPFQLHPVIDHFTVGLLFTAVVIDLFGSFAPQRVWIRYTALTLMVLGALAAGGSFATGDMETDRIWNALGPPAKEVLKTHAELGEYMAITFGVLALWRILIQAVGFMAGSRGIYLIVAIVAAGVLGYTGHLGGELVYEYGAGTALMASQPVPSEGASPAAVPSAAGPVPTVSVPTPMPTMTPVAPAAAAPAPASSSASAASPAESPKPADASSPKPSVQPSAAATGAVSM
ncbi:MAG TPA: DUF2231 domain-containing protein [Candidatus Acidoferrales bacterium]|nr:DUF2231 domain-containing protein [Candidatus Acidoferrales bacterium]